LGGKGVTGKVGQKSKIESRKKKSMRTVSEETHLEHRGGKSIKREMFAKIHLYREHPGSSKWYFEERRSGRTSGGSRGKTRAQGGCLGEDMKSKGEEEDQGTWGKVSAEGDTN